MRNKLTRFFNKASVLSVTIFLLFLWQLTYSFSLLDSFLFPSPITVLTAFAGFFSTLSILPDLLSTLWKIFAAITIGCLTGFLVGTILSKWDFLYASSSPLLDFFRSIPATALFPLFLLLFGPGDSTNVALATWVCALYLSLHVSKALRSTSEAALLTASSLKKSVFDTFLHVKLREGLPMIFLGLRTAVSLTVVVVIVAEMFVGTTRGLGKVLIDSAYTYEIPKLYAGILLVGIIGYLLNYLVIYSEKKIVHWHGK